MFGKRMQRLAGKIISDLFNNKYDSDVISFASGMPHNDLIPVDEFNKATQNVFKNHCDKIFQYNNTFGLFELREQIAAWYKIAKGVEVKVENILITNGAQQAIELIGKSFIDSNDAVIMEEPGFPGAIQALSVYQPMFFSIPIVEEGLNINILKSITKHHDPKIIYTVPDFQNPTGVYYSIENRERVVDALYSKDILLIEDNSYSSLSFTIDKIPSFKSVMPDKTILVGSFSKILFPGFRIGWIIAPNNILKNILDAKQASDLHTSYFTQYIIYQYLKDHDLYQHINKLQIYYQKQCESMIQNIVKYFPQEITYTKPKGGMYIWCSLPLKYSSLKLFDLSFKDKVAIFPGPPFYIKNNCINTFRLSYSNVDNNKIPIGINRLANTINEYINP